MILIATKLARKTDSQLLGKILVQGLDRRERAEPDHPHFRVADHFDRKAVVATELETEEIARHVEGDDLASTFAGHSIAARYPTREFVEIFSRVAFAIEVRTPLERNKRTHDVE